jgi:small subunit ribosomal protein S1
MYKTNYKFRVRHPHWFYETENPKEELINLFQNRFRRSFRAKKPVKGNLEEQTKGGYHIVIHGFTAFCPFSLMYPNPLSDADFKALKLYHHEYLIIEMSDSGPVVSRKEAIRIRAWDKIKGSFSYGTTIVGVVKSVVDYGSFVDLGSIDGLLHVTQLGTNRKESKIFLGSLANGDLLKLKVVAIDAQKMRVSLALPGGIESSRVSNQKPWWVAP